MRKVHFDIGDGEYFSWHKVDETNETVAELAVYDDRKQWPIQRQYILQIGPRGALHLKEIKPERKGMA